MTNEEHETNDLVRWQNRVKMKSKTLALVLGVSESAISQWRRGEKSPGREMAIRIEDASCGEVTVRSWKTTG